MVAAELPGLVEVVFSLLPIPRLAENAATIFVGRPHFWVQPNGLGKVGKGLARLAQFQPGTPAADVCDRVGRFKPHRPIVVGQCHVETAALVI